MWSMGHFSLLELQHLSRFALGNCSPYPNCRRFTPPGMKPDISVRLRGPDIQSIPGEGNEFKAFPVGEGQEYKAVELSKELLELCRVDVPLLKFLPRPAASPFTRAWEGLLRDACSTRSLASWEAVFMFPKAVLLAPFRMGQRL